MSINQPVLDSKGDDVKSNILYARAYMKGDAPGKWEPVKRKDGTVVYQSESRHAANQQIQSWGTRLEYGKFRGKEVVDVSWGWGIVG